MSSSQLADNGPRVSFVPPAAASPHPNLICGDATGTVRRLAAIDDVLVPIRAPWVAAREPITAVAADGGRVVVSERTGKVGLWSTDGGEPRRIRTTRLPSAVLSAVFVDPVTTVI
jgi:hypothetical protein